MRKWVEEECACGRVWRGKPGCSYDCPDCGFEAMTPQQEAAFEQWEEQRNDRANDLS